MDDFEFFWCYNNGLGLIFLVSNSDFEFNYISVWIFIFFLSMNFIYGVIVLFTNLDWSTDLLFYYKEDYVLLILSSIAIVD